MASAPRPGSAGGGAAGLTSGLFARTTVEQLVAAKWALIDVEASRTVAEILLLFQELGVLCVPVWRSPGSASLAARSPGALIIGDKEYMGIVSVLDCVTFALGGAEGGESTAFDASKLPAALERPVAAVLGATPESAAFELAPPFADVLSAMESFKTVHRALVPPATAGDKAKLLTQTDVLDYVLSHRQTSPALDLLFEQPFGTLFHDKAALVTLHDTDDLLVSLYGMVRDGVQAVPVVDGAGKLVATLSVSDLRGVVVAEKLAEIRGFTVADFTRWANEGRAPPAPVSFSADAKLGAILAQALKSRVHRVWIVDAENVPTSVLTFTDVIKLLWQWEVAPPK